MMHGPMDLDPFDEQQIIITRALDAKGKEAIDNLISDALQGSVVVGLAFQSAMPITLWQRAAHEAAIQADRGHPLAAISSHTPGLVILYSACVPMV